MSSADYIRHITFFPKVDEARCRLCGECVRVCLAGAIEFSDEGKLVVHRDMCHNCRRCVNACPAKALSIDAVFDGSGNFGRRHKTVREA